MSVRICIGFGEHEGICPNEADTPAGLWCSACEADRIAHISAQMADITASFRAEREEPHGGE
jgi:hypothetical protein